MNSFNEVLDQIDMKALGRRIEQATAADVERALSHEQPTDYDLMALLSPAAVPYLETLAQRSSALTERRFGKVIQLYTPIYLSNECVNRCTYCGFAHDLAIHRITLTPAQAIQEGRILSAEGFRHVLLVSGEDHRYVGMDYLLEVVAGLRELFDSISIEIQPLSAEEYRQLVEAGVDGLTIYQETYDRDLYAGYHPAGPKRNYRRRIDAIAAGGEAGMRSLGVGALLGLGPWRAEAFAVALHGRWLAAPILAKPRGIQLPAHPPRRRQLRSAEPGQRRGAGSDDVRDAPDPARRRVGRLHARARAPARPAHRPRPHAHERPAAGPIRAVTRVPASTTASSSKLRILARRPRSLP